MAVVEVATPADIKMWAGACVWARASVTGCACMRVCMCEMPVLAGECVRVWVNACAGGLTDSKISVVQVGPQR